MTQVISVIAKNTINNTYFRYSNKILTLTNIVPTISGSEIACVNAFVNWVITKLSREASHICNKKNFITKIIRQNSV